MCVCVCACGFAHSLHRFDEACWRSRFIDFDGIVADIVGIADVVVGCEVNMLGN